MKVLDPGHSYGLRVLDWPYVDQEPQSILMFVKREGSKYPGNTRAHSGTTSQEVLRALIDRAKYVNKQTPCPETEAAIGLLNTALLLFEMRAARCHGRHLEAVTVGDVVHGVCCPKCGHVGCGGHKK